MSKIDSGTWELKGRGFCTICLFRTSTVRTMIPEDYEIKTVVPGYTLGGFYGTHYDASPVGPYDELIVFPGFVGYGDRSGFHVSHIFVNTEKALSGGFNPIEAPRHLKRFSVEFRERRWSFMMYEAGEPAFTSSGRCLTPAFPFSFSIPFLDEQRGEVRWYSALFDTRLQLTSARTKINDDSSISTLARARQLVSVSFQSLHILVGLPIVVPERSRRQVAYPAPVAPAHFL